MHPWLKGCGGGGGGTVVTPSEVCRSCLAQVAAACHLQRLRSAHHEHCPRAADVQRCAVPLLCVEVRRLLFICGGGGGAGGRTTLRQDRMGRLADNLMLDHRPYWVWQLGPTPGPQAPHVRGQPPVVKGWMTSVPARPCRAVPASWAEARLTVGAGRGEEIWGAGGGCHTTGRGG